MTQVNLVNRNDSVIGSCDLLEAHRGYGRQHQAISLFLFQKNEADCWQLLLQQRSQNKTVGAGEWANTLCAHLQPDESHLDCLQRRSQEELGFVCQDSWQIEEFLTFPYQVTCNSEFSENEIDHLFLIKLPGRVGEYLSFSPNLSEVNAAIFVDWLALCEGKLDYKLTPWFALFLDEPLIVDKINRLLD